MFETHSRESSFHYDKKIGIFLKYCSEFFQEIDNYMPKNESSALFCILFYFIQIMSYMIEPYLDNLENSPAIFLFNALYYANFVNFFKLNIFSNVKMGIFATMSAVNFSLLIYFLLIVVFLKLKWGKNCKMSIVNPIISRICFFYYWIYFIPALEIFLNFFDCKNLDTEAVCFQNNSFLFALGTINFMLTLFFGMIFSYFNSDYAFLDIHRLKTSFNINFELANLMRIAIVIVKRITSDAKWIFFLIVFLFLFFTFAFNFQTNPFRHRKLKIFFLGNMLSCFFFLIILILWQLDLIREFDILFVYLPLTILAFKISTKISEYFYYKTFILQNDNFNIFSGEEIYQIHNVENYSKIALLLGFFKSHFRVCSISECKKLQTKEVLMMLERFISLHIQKEIEKTKKKKKASTNFDKEYLLLKYLSFLVDYEQNFVKAHYEVQSNIDKNESFSIFFHIVLSFLKNKIKNKLKFSIKTSSFSNSSSVSENQGFYQFFKAYKLKKKMEIEIVQLLKYKNSFFHSFIKGNKSLLDLLSRSAELIPKIEKIKKKIKSLKTQKSPFYNVISLKFESILYCLIFNNLWEGRKEEQEILINIGRDSGPKSLFNSQFNFLDKNFIVLEVQFINSDGILKDFSFSEKFKNFFHYKKENKTPKDLLNYMPSFIAEIHPQFINNFLTNKSSSNKELGFESYGKDADGFIFPISTHLGFNLDWHNQFVMYAALKKSKNTSEKIFICNNFGEIQNVSRSAFEELNKEYEFIIKEDIEMLNIYSFIPKLEEMIGLIQKKEQRNFKDQNIRNQFSLMYFPQNLNRFLKFSKIKKFKQEETGSGAATLHSKTDKRVKKKLYNHKYEMSGINDSTSNMKTKLILSREVCLDEDKSPITANISFNLSFFRHSYGEKGNQNLEYFSVHILEFKKNKTPKTVEVLTIIEDTAQINETLLRDELKIPVENVQILNLFTRDQLPETVLFDGSQEKQNNRENINDIDLRETSPQIVKYYAKGNNKKGKKFKLLV